MSPRRVEVPTPGGSTRVHVWENQSLCAQTVVTVHPWATLGGSEANTVGVARELAASGLRAITFQLAASSALWGILSTHSAEVAQVEAVCKWATDTYGGQLVLFGSSAGAPIAGSVLPRLQTPVTYIGLGYTFGRFAALGFGRHFGPLLRSDCPKLFIHGENDEFTSVPTLQASRPHQALARACTTRGPPSDPQPPRTRAAQAAVAKAAGPVNEVVIERGVGHFELEQPGADQLVAGRIVDFLRELRPAAAAAARGAAMTGGTAPPPDSPA